MLTGFTNTTQIPNGAPVEGFGTPTRAAISSCTSTTYTMSMTLPWTSFACPRVTRRPLLRYCAMLPAFGSRHRARRGAVKPVLREEDIAADRWQDPTSWRSRDCGQILGTLCRC
jgi:hypothetical protein